MNSSNDHYNNVYKYPTIDMNCLYNYIYIDEDNRGNQIDTDIVNDAEKHLGDKIINNEIKCVSSESNAKESVISKLCLKEATPEEMRLKTIDKNEHEIWNKGVGA